MDDAGRSRADNELPDGVIGAIVDQVLADHAAVVAEFRAGDDKVRKGKRGFLFGQVMTATNRTGNPAVINTLLDERLQG